MESALLPGNIKVRFVCPQCTEIVDKTLWTKDANNETMKETNYTNVTCSQCKQVYAVKAIIETREG